MRYSFNMDKSDMVFAQQQDINASYKDLGAVCDAIRYRSVPNAMALLDEASQGARAILFKRHNRYMGDRHELGGRKGRFPMKCAKIVMSVLANASANAKNKGYAPELMFVLHASANKTLVSMRVPPKGARAVVVGGYGYTSMRRSNLEFARVEIGISSKYEGKVGKGKEQLIKMFNRERKKPEASAVQQKRKPFLLGGKGKAAEPKKPEAAKKEQAKAASPAAQANATTQN